jgi:phospholipid transport system substrate-binding protein
MTLGKAFSAILASAFVLTLSIGQSARAGQQASPDEAAKFVETLGNKAVVILESNTGGVPEKRQAALRDLIRDGFDLELTSQFVLGKFWNKASPDQREEFQDLFTRYLLNSYARHLSSFRADTLTIVGSNPAGERDILVETSIENGEGAVKAVWRVRSDQPEYKIIDVSVDGVSLALTQRREFAAVVNRKGLDGLLRLLRQKVSAQAQTVRRMRPSRRGDHVSLLASILASPNANPLGLLLAGR